MIRQIIKIDEDKCDGCGLCAIACHEGAIEIIDGKARLTREHFCDGLGDCLPSCPTGAITFELREAPAYDEAAVLASQHGAKYGSAESMADSAGNSTSGESGVFGAVSSADAGAKGVQRHGGCPGSAAVKLGGCPGSAAVKLGGSAARSENAGFTPVTEISVSAGSQLCNWPVQIKLVPVNAPYFDGAKLLVAADCTAFAYANMHAEFMRGRVTLIGCPKLDAVDYSEKLVEILRLNDIKSLTIVRMEVPCCGGIQTAAEKALRESGKFIPWQVVTISRDGKILDR